MRCSALTLLTLPSPPHISNPEAGTSCHLPETPPDTAPDTRALRQPGFPCLFPESTEEATAGLQERGACLTRGRRAST